MRAYSIRGTSGWGGLQIASALTLMWGCASGRVNDGSGEASPSGLAPSAEAGPEAAAPTDDPDASEDGDFAPESGQPAVEQDAEGAQDASSSTGADDAAGEDGGEVEQDATLPPDASGDAGLLDASAFDATPRDASPTDSGELDSGLDSATPTDAGTADAGHDAGAPDAGTSDAGCGSVTVVVNELQSGSAGSAEDEWVELFNPRACAVDLSGWTLKYSSIDGTAKYVVWTGVAGDTLGPLGYAVIVGTAYTGAATPIGALTSGLAAAGGGVGIYDATSTLLDSVGYGAGATNGLVETSPAAAPPPGESIARLPNGTDTGDNAHDFAIAATPTPGAPN